MINDILVEQNPHWRGTAYASIKREKLQQLIKYLPLKQVITISGVRRCGKSTLAKQAMNYLLAEKVAAENIFFINLEHPFFLDFRHDANYLNTIHETYIKLMNPEGRVYIIFDEIQFFENWQVYVKSKYENSNIKFIITGSNSSMLSNEMNTLLSGRCLTIHLHTFSFTEFLDYKSIDYQNELVRIDHRIDIARAKDEYLKWGGFFEVFDVDDEQIKSELLISYAKNIIYQDIVPRYSIRNTEVVEKLFFYLLSNIGGTLNYTSLATTFAVSDKSIKEYLNYFEDAFLLKRIDKFHNKPKERIKSSKKVYALDNGFLQIAPRHSKNLGKSLENSVFLQLYRDHSAITYLKNNYEIDFFVNQNYFQVAYDISEPKTLKRELNAFKHFDISTKAACKLITYDSDVEHDAVEIIDFEHFIFQQ